MNNIQDNITHILLILIDISLGIKDIQFYITFTIDYLICNFDSHRCMHIKSIKHLVLTYKRPNQEQRGSK